ncbi:electron transport complex subunit RsxC [Alteromonas gilva]|uniref:Ion-translocating oxidoreductase complex subunit C n=1 Tax=Alteromonas gilva TaxID=2987522 RepID=A0ABT5L3K8_9ALTE|nr:electron transport complex subunit RsxC [Alteromonas gilva]MDC8831616.1 electron transport complex subunit RsxC [Alteromonas gilva]
MQNEFSQILDRIDQQKFWTFPGGVNPDYRKQLSNQTEITSLPLPPKLVIPVRQHIGTAGSCLVSVGDAVLKGQPLTSSPNPFSVPIHAPTSGTVTAIEDCTTAHPSGLPELCVIIEPDGLDTWTALQPLHDYQQLDKKVLLNAICDAGIAGMGGAGFPTHIKSTARKPVEFLIINGVECEPYITADDRLMREHAWQIRQGVDILHHLIAPKVIVIAIEDNKPQAFKAMQKVCADNAHIRVVQIPTKYPAGGEKQLIQVLTGREVPRTGLPADVGVMMFNVGTCYAIADAVLYGKPLIQRVVTLTGEALQKPQNVWALIGTPIQQLLNHAHYQIKRQKTPTVIMGGPMMGFTLPSVDVPVVKITNCILVPAKKELNMSQRELACIRCSACADVCPASLLPQQMYWHSKAGELDKAEDYNLFDCIECGACAFVCPSEIPLVHYYRKAKSQIRIQRDEKDKAEKSRQRFEARKARLEKEKQEREAKHQKAAAARKQVKQTSDDDSNSAKDKVAAALARAKAKKASQSDITASTPEDPATTSPADNVEPADNKAKVAAAVARAKAKRARQTEDNDGSADKDTETENKATTSADTERQAKVAAAVARAKAKKAAAQQSNDTAQSDTTRAQPEDSRANVPQATDNAPTEDSPEAQRKAKIAAAVARAKAKKAGTHSNTETEHTDTKPESADADIDTSSQSNSKVTIDDSPEARRKAKIAAAVARAKAKKAATQQASPDDAPTPGNNTPEDTPEAQPAETNNDGDAATTDTSPAAQRSAKIAAAVARAKAKKAQRENQGNDEGNTDA